MPSADPSLRPDGSCVLCYNKLTNTVTKKKYSHAQTCGMYKGRKDPAPAKELPGIDRPPSSQDPGGMPCPILGGAGPHRVVHAQDGSSSSHLRAFRQSKLHTQLLPAGSSSRTGVEPGSSGEESHGVTPVTAGSTTRAEAEGEEEQQLSTPACPASPAASSAGWAVTPGLAAAVANFIEAEPAAALAAALLPLEPGPTTAPAAAPAAAPTAAPTAAPAVAEAGRRSSRSPARSALGQMMDAAVARSAADQASRKRKLINTMQVAINDPSAAGPSTVAAPAAAAATGPRWECTSCAKAVPVPPSPFDAQVAELLGGGRTLASVLPTYAQLELEGLSSAAAAMALVVARAALPKVKPDMVAKHFAAAEKQNKGRGVPPGILKFALAAAIAAAEERELRVKLGTWAPRGQLLRLTVPVSLWKPGLQPEEDSFMFGGQEPAVLLLADFRDVGVAEYLCWKQGCGGRCRVLQSFGRTAYTNVHSPTAQPQRIAHFGRLWSIAPKIKCALTT